MIRSFEVRPVLENLDEDFSGQVQDFINEAEKEIERNWTSACNNFDQKMAEDLASYLKDRK